MDKLNRKELDAITGQEIVTELTKQEIDERAALAKANEAAAITELSEKATAKAALLDRLGITEQEAKLLMS